MDYFGKEAADRPDVRNDGKGKEGNGRPQVPRKDDPSPEVALRNVSQMDCKGKEGNGCQQNDRNDIPSRKDIPSLETVLRNVMQMEFLTDEVKNSFVAASITHSKASPKAQQLKYFIDNINVADPDRQHSLIKAAVTCYLNDKKLEETNGGTVAKQKQCMATLSMIGDTVSSRVNSNPSPPFDPRDSDSDDSHEYDVETGNGETCNKRGDASRHGVAFRPQDGMETRHSNVADAMDSLGPAVIAKRTQSAPQGSSIPQGWYVREFQCYDNTCQTKILVWSPTTDLWSTPAFSLVYDNSKHRAHNPIDWEGWYRYKTGRDPSSPDWDVTTYPQRPGLPHSVLLAVAEQLRINPNIKPVEAAIAVRERFSNPPHPLFGRPGILDGMIMKQTQDHQIGWEATLRSGPEWIHEMARTLQREKVVAALGCNEHRPETHLVVLDSDEVFSNERWQTLHQASDKVHMTGPDTRRRTVVFSSIALLAISVWCENMSWEVCGSVDGTHGISDSSYKLITLGVNAFRKETMRQSFHPLVYIWGEGEREIVALHGFLNWKIAVRHLFGINSVCFKRGVVSDSTSVFSNSVRAAFPGSPPLSCYPHIIRKFKIGDRSGNGSYAAKVKNGGPMWLKTEAEEAIRRCSFCKTEQQMLKMWELTEKKWVMDGQEALAETFAKTYINNNDFNKWYYTASGQHGCVPCNNAMESHHLQMKGSKYFYGFMEHGADMRTCLTIYFVRLVYNASVSLSSPSWGLPVLDYGRASQNDDFMKFQSLLDPKVDIKEYNDGWLINDATYLATPITEDDIAKMEMALSGKMEEDAEAHVGDRDIRDILLSRTTRFHHVKRSVWTFEKNNDVYFHCDCRDYYYTQWCFQSAYMQHREELQLLGKKITSKRSKTSNSSKRRKIIKDALKAAEERIDAQNIKNGN
ncbi:hypothetical protein IV203_031649 [Nitzschia inconspicua]|uniref:Uncharacterized protein n=1 Tax=Nitzschia inconspicua TaxID=303405 RepID=A0A9K3Q2T9_9STRA|nr:hypothetical protein IV203_031649 [Nitzschia inconspicua]